MRNPLQLSLSAAAKEVDRSKSTLSRAIKEGRLSATRCENGSYQIDPAELYRVFPAPVPQPTTSNAAQPESERDGTLRMQLEVAERERDREREERSREREQMQATIDDLRARLDRAESRIAGLLPAPPTPRRRWGLWGRS
jgi:hypothetical protein